MKSVSSNVMHDSQSNIKRDHVLTSASNKMLGWEQIVILQDTAAVLAAPRSLS